MDASVSSGALYSLPYAGLADRSLGNKERDKTVVVAEKKAFETTHKVSQFWVDTSQAVVQYTFDVQGRSLQYLQNTFRDGIETFQGNIESFQRWLQTANKSQSQQESIPSFMESSVEAQKRYFSFLQRAVERGTDTIRSNTEDIRNLTQTTIHKIQDQQDTIWS